MSNQYTTIEKTLSQRKDQYGSFEDVSKTSQMLQKLLKRDDYTSEQAEAIQMICSKLSRIRHGDPNYLDSWVDIAGYATLVADSKTQHSQKNKVTPPHSTMPSNYKDITLMQSKSYE